MFNGHHKLISKQLEGKLRTEKQYKFELFFLRNFSTRTKKKYMQKES